MDIHEDLFNLIIGLGILVGALQCFFGYRIFKFILGLTGFLIGGTLAGAIGYTYSQEVVFVLLTGLVGGFLGAVLMVALYFVGVFLVGSILGGIFGAALYTIAESTPEPAVLLILAVITGVLSLIFQKFMIIVSTGFGGAWAVVIGIAHFTIYSFYPTNLEQMIGTGGSYMYAIMLCWLALGIFGVIVQYYYPSSMKSQSVIVPNSENDSSLSIVSEPKR